MSQKYKAERTTGERGCHQCAFKDIDCADISKDLYENHGLPDCADTSDGATLGYHYVKVKKNRVKLYAVEDADCKGCVFERADYRVCNEFQNIAPILKLPKCGVKEDSSKSEYIGYIYVTKKPKVA